MKCDRGRVGRRGECDLGDPFAPLSIGFAVFWLALTQTLPVLPER